VELPLSGEVSVGATLGQKTAELKVPIKGDRMTIEIHTNWITGRIRFKPLVPDSVA
jgi:stress response protein YsnF